MKLRELLAKRLRELMDVRPDLDTQTKLANRAGLSQSTIQRILSLQQACTVDVIEDLARAFGIRPIELLIEDRNDVLLLTALNKLSAEEKLRVLAYIEVSTGASLRHHERAQLSIDTGRPVPPQLAAASTRASAREPAVSDDVQQAHEQASTPQRKRGKS